MTRFGPAGLGLLFLLAGCASDPPGVQAGPEPQPVDYQYTVVNVFDHDPEAYTQGLEFVDGRLLESTGRTGQSTIRLVEPDTGVVVTQERLDDTLFGEGTTVVGDRIWQLTYRAELALHRNRDDLRLEQQVGYDGQGWGLCYDGTALVMSNGSDTLTIRDPQSFAPIRTIAVTRDGEPVPRLNELECVDGTVWANIYQSNEIVAIDGDTGVVTGLVDLTDLVPEQYEDSNTYVLNGIAYNQTTGRFWVTGKNWPVMYELNLTNS